MSDWEDAVWRRVEARIAEDNEMEHKGVLTVLHKNCGGQVLSTGWLSWKTVSLIQDGTLGCCLCSKQPLNEDETFQDYR